MTCVSLAQIKLRLNLKKNFLNIPVRDETGQECKYRNNFRFDKIYLPFRENFL